MPKVVKADSALNGPRRVQHRRTAWSCADQEEGSFAEFARIGAVALFVLGIVTCYRFVWMTLVSGFLVVARMIDEETGFPISVEAVAVVCIMATSLVTISATIGYVGINNRRMPALCTYFFLNILLACFFLFIFVYAEAVETKVSQIMAVHAIDFCNVSVHSVVEAVFKCHDGRNIGNVTALQEQCGCEAQVRHAARLGGCPLLEVLCHSYMYTNVGRGMCVLASSNESEQPEVIRSAFGQYATEECCREACDAEVQCIGFVYDRAPKARVCGLISPKIPRLDPLSKHKRMNPQRITPIRRKEGRLLQANESESESEAVAEPVKSEGWIGFERPTTVPEWDCAGYAWLLPANATQHEDWWRERNDDNLEIVGSTNFPDDGEVNCFRKESDSIVMERISTAGYWIVFCSMFVWAILLLATACACYFQYLLVPLRIRRTRGLHRVCFKMVCPCSFMQGDDDILDKYASKRQTARRIPRSDSTNSNSSASPYTSSSE